MDNAKDFLNRELREFFESEGIRHETSCHYTPQQNGLAERKIGDVVDKGRTLLIQAGMPANMWSVAVMTAIHLINRLSSRILGMKSPLQLLEEKYPKVKLKTGLPVKIFGCIGYVYSPAHRTDKWSTKGLKCVFVGYSTTQKGYKLYIVSKDVVFDENQFFYKPIRHIRSTPTSDVTNSSDLLGQKSESSDNSPNHTDNQDLNISPHSIPPLQTSLT